MFNFTPILQGLPMPANLRSPRRAATDVIEREGVELFRVVVHGPDDSPTCYGLGPTPECALRTALLGLLQTIESHGLGDVAEAVAYTVRRTAN